MTSSVYVFGNGVQEGLIKSFHSIFKKCLDLYMGSLIWNAVALKIQSGSIFYFILFLFLFFILPILILKYYPINRKDYERSLYFSTCNFTSCSAATHGNRLCCLF